MSTVIRLFFASEALSSVIFGWFIVIVPQFFASFLLGQELDEAGLRMVQLYGAMISAWGAIYFYYFRTNTWEIFKGFVLFTMAGSVPTILVLGVMSMEEASTFGVLAYLLFTVLGFALRVTCLYKPQVLKMKM